jgi:hypothetical protein
MDQRFMCFCGLYCENCAVKVNVHPAAVVLRNELSNTGFEEVAPKLPGGGEFWSFLNDMADNWVCLSCKEGSGNPDCAIRTCAREKEVDMCALCDSYPCGLFDNFTEGYPILEQDNALLRDKGIEEWSKLQDERRARGFTYSK